jgi:hypothetical protein
MHPNVLGKQLCLDMLEEGFWALKDIANQPYTGWSSAYSVSAILRQLQVFLLDRNKHLEYRNTNEATIARNYQCTHCQHKGTMPWPPMANTDKIIEARLLQAPKIAASSKAMSRLFNALRGEEEGEEDEEESASFERDNKNTKENIQPNIQPQSNAVAVEPKQNDASAAKELQAPVQVSTAVPVTPAKVNSQQKKQTKPKSAKAKQNKNQKKSKVPAGFIIEEECAVPSKDGKKKKSPPSYVDALIKETIEKEKEKQIKAQKKKAKKAQKKQAPAKSEQVSDVTPIVAPVTTNATASEVTPVKSVIAETPAPCKQEPEIVEEQQVGEAQSLSDMPYDVLLNMIQHISWTDLTSLACVDYKLSTLTQESHVWKTLCMKYIPSAPLIVKKFMKGGKSTRVSGGTTTWRSMFLRGREFIKNELRCFHTKLSFEDDVLGIPLNVVYGAGTNRWISDISTTFDIISQQAFHEEGIRKACWKQPFKFWMPIYINEKHASNARRYFEASVRRILDKPFNPSDVLVILPKLMSTMVVELSNQKSHASMKALEGYCWFHRWFLEYVTMYPSVRAGVNNRIASFIQDPVFRTKKHTPSLGEWICLLSVSDKYKWSDVSAAYINESFDRNAKWSLTTFPELQQLDLSCDDRMVKTFEGCLVSIRLLMFHVFFLDFVKPRGLSLARIKEEYDAFFGMLSHSQKETFQQGVFKILKIDNWEDFLYNIKLKTIPSEAQFEKILINAILNSYCKGYHKVHSHEIQRVDLVYSLLK